MANIPVQQAVFPTGALLTRQACAGGGDSVKVGAHIALIFKNSDASPHTATFVVPGTTYGIANPDVPVVIAAGAERLVLVPKKGLDTGGVVSITYDGVTSLTVCAVNV